MLPDTRSWSDLKAVVMGLHWAPPSEHGRHTPKPANLDAICVLLDAQNERLESIHPSRLTNANGSVVHTGDSLTGASMWDDERVFVFLDALPGVVHSLVLGVVSRNGEPFCAVAGATCHVSHCYGTEDELLSVQLTALGPRTEYCVATLQRSAFGWIMQKGALPGTQLTDPLSRP